MTPIAPKTALRAFLSLLVASLLGASLVAGCGGSAGPPEPKPDPRAEFMPAPGAYEYRTQGSERVDALLGAVNRYPRRTRIRVVHRGCGYSERWAAGRERWIEFSYCVEPDGSRSLRSLRDYHEFFGSPMALGYRCKGASVPNFEMVRAGFKWTDRCKAQSTNLTLKGRIGGRRTIQIAGRGVETVSVQIVATSTGRSVGQTRLATQRVVPTGLVARRISRGSASTRTSIGRVRSSENYRIELESLRPAPPTAD